MKYSDKLLYFYNVSSLKKLDMNDLKSLTKQEGTHIVYIGRPTCGYCIDFVPKLNKVVKETNLEVNYYDTDKNRKDLQMTELLTELNVETFPAVIVVKDKTVVKQIKPTKLSAIDLENEFLKYN
ncbi:thioredoxin family protein [Carnobacterium maltaromaticum]|uniref:thioredoxin family protein n=1 Tax=Carnobacterium maltaromaticum TaxID=2751 RepID=UPI0018CC8021|nr:thioredoxin family protein [Carnobacterium maltaromaticum]